jgi:antitoxin HigA-1
MNYRRRRAQHPGEILSEEWLKPLGFRAAEFAMIWGFDQDALRDIVAGKKPIDPTMSRQLHISLGTPEDYWLEKQREYDGHARTPEFETIQ